jgi:hypothetical protein
MTFWYISSHFFLTHYDNNEKKQQLFVLAVGHSEVGLASFKSAFVPHGLACDARNNDGG